MQQTLFATTNEHKLAEASQILGRELAGFAADIPEIQSLDHVAVAMAKAEAYFQVAKQPIFVEDNSLDFLALGKLPGTYINDFFSELGNEGLALLLHGNMDRSAVARSVIAFADAKGQISSFVGEVEGKIALNPRGKNGFGWDPIFIPKGEQSTLAEMTAAEKNRYSMRRKSLEQFREWLDHNGSL